MSDRRKTVQEILTVGRTLKSIEEQIDRDIVMVQDIVMGLDAKCTNEELLQACGSIGKHVRNLQNVVWMRRELKKGESGVTG